MQDRVSTAHVRRPAPRHDTDRIHAPGATAEIEGTVAHPHATTPVATGQRSVKPVGPDAVQLGEAPAPESGCGTSRGGRAHYGASRSDRSERHHLRTVTSRCRDHTVRRTPRRSGADSQADSRTTSLLPTRCPPWSYDHRTCPPPTCQISEHTSSSSCRSPGIWLVAARICVLIRHRVRLSPVC